MKKLYYLIMVIALFFSRCADKDRSLLEGTWRCVSEGSVLFADTSFKVMVGNGMIKTFSKGYFTFIGKITNDSLTIDQYGAGTYTLNGNRYEEYILYHEVKSLIGKKFKAIDEIRNDTLYHRYNTDTISGWKLGKGYVTEKFVRLK